MAYYLGIYIRVMLKIKHMKNSESALFGISKKSLSRTSMTLSLMFGCLLLVALSSCYTVPAAEDDGVVYQNYVPPSWAPPYDNVSMVQYYYFPDYEMYYDVWGRTFWCQENGGWVSYPGLPPAYAGIDLSASFIVLIDRNVHEPWRNHGYYRDNYPRHGYDNYRDIVVNNRIVTNIQPGHELVPRSYNENNDRVTFMQHPRVNAPAPGQPASAPVLPTPYHHITHEVPMRAIAPSMPKESRAFNYGSGVRRNAPAAAQPASRPPEGGKK
jgi:hypothetical protein